MKNLFSDIIWGKGLHQFGVLFFLCVSRPSKDRHNLRFWLPRPTFCRFSFSVVCILHFQIASFYDILKKKGLSKDIPRFLENI